MADAQWMEYRLFCPVCNVYFTQLVVLHKLPKNFNMEPYLAGLVESHDHKAYQEAKAQKENPEPADTAKGAAMNEEERKQRLERLDECVRRGEDAYDQLYDPRTHTNPAGHYSEAKDSFGEAIHLAHELGLDEQAQTLSDRLQHIKDVFRSQFS